VFVHGFLLGADGRKMSKSLGNVLDPFEVIEEFGTDALRFYLMRDVPSATTAPWGWTRCAFATTPSSRTGSAISPAARSRWSSATGTGWSPRSNRDPELDAEFDGLPQEIEALMAGPRVTLALDRIWRRVRRLNRYVEEQAPWQLARDPADADKLDQVLASLIEGCGP